MKVYDIITDRIFAALDEGTIPLEAKNTARKNLLQSLEPLFSAVIRASSRRPSRTAPQRAADFILGHAAEQIETKQEAA